MEEVKTLKDLNTQYAETLSWATLGKSEPMQFPVEIEAYLMGRMDAGIDFITKNQLPVGAILAGTAHSLCLTQNSKTQVIDHDPVAMEMVATLATEYGPVAVAKLYSRAVTFAVGLAVEQMKVTPPAVEEQPLLMYTWNLPDNSFVAVCSRTQEQALEIAKKEYQGGVLNYLMNNEPDHCIVVHEGSTIWRFSPSLKKG